MIVYQYASIMIRLLSVRFFIGDFTHFRAFLYEVVDVPLYSVFA
jgi:hypothetical protein